LIEKQPLTSNIAPRNRWYQARSQRLGHRPARVRSGARLPHPAAV